jgi:hypothetical protein
MNPTTVEQFSQNELKTVYSVNGNRTDGKSKGCYSKGEKWLSKDKKSITNYPGQHHCASQLAKYFPKEFKVYAEPFCGKARTAKYAQDVCGQENMILFDLGDWALEYCKKTFPKANVYKIGFTDSIEQLRKMDDVFMFIDPPWYSFPAYVMTNSIKEYYNQVLEILERPGTVCKWMIVASIKKDRVLINSKYPNEVIYNDHGATMNGGLIGVRFIKNY